MHACTAAQLVATFPNLTDVDLTSATPCDVNELGQILRLSRLQSIALHPIKIPSEASRALEQAVGSRLAEPEDPPSPGSSHTQLC